SIPPPPLPYPLPYTTLFRSQPVASFVLTRFHQDPFALQAFSVETQLELVILFLEELIRAGVPDRHRPRAVAVRDHAMERQVLDRSEEHTSELQSRFDLVCRL